MTTAITSTTGTTYVTSFTTSCLACIAANLATHPFETLKTRQQLISTSATTSTTALARSLIQNEGVAALYKGLNASLIRACISGAGRLTLNESLKNNCIHFGWLQPPSKAADLSEVPLRASLAIASGCFAAFLSSPIDMIRTRQAAAKGTFSACPSITQLFLTTYQQNGIPGLFAGWSSLMGRAATFNAGQLVAYDVCKSWAMDFLHMPSEHVFVHVVASLGAGIVACTASVPMENIKTVQQMETKKPLMSIVPVARQLYRNGGPKQFFRGWLTLYTKIGPNTFIVFLTAEYLRNMAGLDGF